MSQGVANVSVPECEHALHGTIQNFAFVILTIIILVGGPGSIIVATAIYRRHGLLDRPSYYYILSLIVIDGLVCITEVPMDLLYWSYFPDWPLKGFASNLWNSYSLFLLTASVLCIFAISVDRYLAVVSSPLKYNSVFTTWKARVTVIIIWAYSLVLAICMYFSFNTPADYSYSFQLPLLLYTLYLVLHVLLPFVISIYCCVRVYMIGRGVLRQLYKLERVMKEGERHRSQQVSPTVTDCRTTSSKQNKLAREMKLAKIVAAVLSCFIAVYVPFATVQLISNIQYGGIRELTGKKSPCILYKANSMVWLLSHLNNGIDPVLTLYIDNLVRMESKRMLFGRTRLDSVSVFTVHYDRSHARLSAMTK